jgi:hypothetical protein
MDAGHAGHAFGSGHCTTGQRGLGHGGHSPILHGFEHVLIQGGQLGTEVLRTYLDISGWGGHSVFIIYLLISGIGGHGGTVAFRTHLLGSGSIQGGQTGAGNCFTIGLGQSHGLFLPHELQVSQVSSSMLLNPSVRRREPSRNPVSNATTIAAINKDIPNFILSTLTD